MKRLLIILIMFASFAVKAEIKNHTHYPLEPYADSIAVILGIPDNVDISIIPITDPIVETMFRGLTQEISENEYVIHLNRYMSKGQCIVTLIHEFIHVDDLVRDVLIQLNKTNEYIYKGEKYSFEGTAIEYEKNVETDTRAKTDSINHILYRKFYPEQ